MQHYTVPPSPLSDEYDGTILYVLGSYWSSNVWKVIIWQHLQDVKLVTCDTQISVERNDAISTGQG